MPHHHNERMWQSRTAHLIAGKERERVGGKKGRCREGRAGDRRRGKGRAGEGRGGQSREREGWGYYFTISVPWMDDLRNFQGPTTHGFHHLYIEVHWEPSI